MNKISFLLLLVCSVFMASASATPVIGTIEDVYCGEVNPYHVGDVCIIFTTDEATGVKLGLVYDDYDWLTLHVPSDSSSDDMAGDRFKATGCKKIRSSGDIRELQNLSSDHFYLSCDIYGFKYF